MSKKSGKPQPPAAAPPPRPERPGSRLAKGRSGWASGRKIGIALGVLLLVVVLGALSMHRVGPEGRTYRLRIGGGEPTRLEPGWNVAVPLYHKLIRIPVGPIEVAEEIPVGIHEGATLVLPFSVKAEIGDAALEAILAGPRAGEGPQGEMRRAAAAAIDDWSSTLSAEALVLMQGAAGMREVIGERLEGRGFEAVSVEVGRIGGPAAVLASIGAKALGDRVVDTGTRIAILALDGADWQIIDPLIDRGELPTLARLRANGAWGNVRSLDPMLSPLLWTSVATGKMGDKHGIIDFLVHDEETGEAVPVTSRWRKVKALWNIFTDVGRSSAFIAWWATWPAERVTGHLISDRVAYSLFGFEAGEGDRVGATHPPDYLQRIQQYLVDDSQITLADVQRFATVTAGEFSELRARLKDDPKVGYREPVNHLTKILAAARTYHAIGLDILAGGQPNLFAIYFQGIDEVCHRFAHYMPPKMEMVTEEEFRKYKGAVAAYYRYQDRLLGEILDNLDPDTTVIVLSDHGFKNGTARPRDEPPYIEGKPGLWHRRYGIVIFSGPAIRPGRLDTTSLLDIAPTVLYLSGLPVAEDMEGRVVKEAISEEFQALYPMTTLASYEGIGQPLEFDSDVVASSAMDEEIMAQLRALGYIGGGGGAADREGGSIAEPARDGGTLATGHQNAAKLYLQKKDYEAAEAAVEKALEISPNMLSAWTLRAQIAAEQKQFDAALDAVKHVLGVDPVGEAQIYLNMSSIYIDSGRVDEGLEYMRRAAREYPDIAEIHSSVGKLLLEKGDEEEAEKELLAALEIDPALGEPLADLHEIYQGTDRIMKLEGIVRKGLSINNQSVVHHNWMGLIHGFRGERSLAERSFKRAMDLDPEYTATMANLGALYGRAGRLEEAVEILRLAVSKEEDNLEAWVNLGAALGRLRRPGEAIEALETAREMGARTTTLYNALALAYMQDGRRDKALEYLNESLEIDPDQKDARDLLNSLLN